MLQNLDDQVRDCRLRAADCTKQANQVVDSRKRAEWLSLRCRYLALANNIETKRRRKAPSKQAPPYPLSQRQMSLKVSGDIAV